MPDTGRGSSVASARSGYALSDDGELLSPSGAPSSPLGQKARSKFTGQKALDRTEGATGVMEGAPMGAAGNFASRDKV